MRILVLNWRDPAHPAAGGAEVYTGQVLRRWAAAGHDVTLFAAEVGRPAAQRSRRRLPDRARGGRLTVYRQARRWWQRFGRGRFDVVVDETNTVPFMAHEWVDDGARTIALVHQTCEEIWHVQRAVPVVPPGPPCARTTVAAAPGPFADPRRVGFHPRRTRPLRGGRRDRGAGGIRARAAKGAAYQGVAADDRLLWTDGRLQAPHRRAPRGRARTLAVARPSGLDDRWRAAVGAPAHRCAVVGHIPRSGQ